MEESSLERPKLHKEFYYQLGLLSTKFAEVEINTMSLLGKLVIDDLFLINTIIEKNSLSQNVDLLKKINLFRRFEEETLRKLIEKISAVRSERNLFIHALWGEPFLKDEKLFISCMEPKIVSKTDARGRTWTSGKRHEFELQYLSAKIGEIDLILKIQRTLLQKLEDTTFE